MSNEKNPRALGGDDVIAARGIKGLAGLAAREANPWLTAPTTAEKIAITCDEVKTVLLAKNAAYGDSATAPLRVFSRANAEEAILVRIDDKLSRIARGHEFADEDTVLDLIGYLVLLRVQRMRGSK